MPLYEYRCPACGRLSEHLRPAGQHTAPCACGAEASRVPSRFALLNPPTGAGLRSRFSLFQEASQELNHAHVQAEAAQERALPPPDLWGAAKAKAQAMIAAGEAPALAPAS